MSRQPFPAVRAVEPPQRILLATDLSCRCDRAQDRAVWLAEQWDARLTLLHVLEAPASDLPSGRHATDTRIAERHFQPGLHGRAIAFDIVLERGDPTGVILTQAIERNCQMIVTGVAQHRVLGAVRLGQTVEHLTRWAPMPVLVVKSRACQSYARIVVATDRSEPSRLALAHALALFPEASITLFHAFGVPFEGVIDRQAHEAEYRNAAREECSVFLANVPGSPDLIGQVEMLVEHGSPEALIGAYVQDMDVDLVILGAHGRAGASRGLIGSSAARLLASLTCDVMMVRPPQEMLQ
ncbi:MAG: universal stress protein [Acetobacteraceae bacterium]